jgi:filamentous hemagglutinin
VNELTDTLNPFGTGTAYFVGDHPDFGNWKAYGLGQYPGRGAGIAYNAVLTVYGAKWLVQGAYRLAALHASGGLSLHLSGSALALETSTTGALTAVAEGLLGSAVLTGVSSNVSDMFDPVMQQSGNAGGGGPKRTLQTGGQTISKRTARALGLGKRRAGRAIESLKRDLRIPANHHGKIMSDGSYVDPHTGETLGNLYHYLD